jgi:hypothetical protein
MVGFIFFSHIFLSGGYISIDGQTAKDAEDAENNLDVSFSAYLRALCGLMSQSWLNQALPQVFVEKFEGASPGQFG